MVYANDQWVQLPVRDLYDSQIMAMAINAAKDMYEKGLQEMKDFNKEYGDFMTPIAADQDWYNKNVTGRVRNVVNAIYAAGGDPLRDPQARAMISRELAGLPYGDIAMIKSSAENAREYLKARRQLEMAGLYNPLYAKYDGPDLSTYATVGENGQGIWDKMSPTPFNNISAFSKDYFEGLKPNIRTESRNGITYQVKEISENDLRKIAEDKFNELKNTPQGSLMYARYLDITGDEDAARQMFNDAIVNANLRRTYREDNYDDNYLEMEKLKMQQDMNQWKKQVDSATLELQRQALQLKALTGTGSGKKGTGTSGLGYDYEDYFNEDEWQLANNLGAAMASTDVGKNNGILDYTDFDPLSQGALWPQAYEEIIDRNYGNILSKNTTISRSENSDYIAPSDNRLGLSTDRINIGITPGYGYSDISEGITGKFSLPYSFDKKIFGGKRLSKSQLSEIRVANQNFINDISQSYDPAKFAKWCNRSTVSEDDTMMNVCNDDDFINRTHHTDETTANSYGIGYSQDQINQMKEYTDSRRKILNKNRENLYAKGVGKIYSILGVDGVTHLYVPVKFYKKTGRGSNVRYEELPGGISAFDMGISTRENPNFGINGQAVSNLYMNPNSDSDIRLGGNIHAGKYLGLQNPSIKMNTAIP